MDRLRALHDIGVSIWLDTLSRELLESGEFAHLVEHCHVSFECTPDLADNTDATVDQAADLAPDAGRPPP